MKKYRVTFYYEESGYTYVFANSKKQAEKKVYDNLQEYGLEKLDNFECQNREYEICSSEKIEY